jgi:hypothetical protein
MSIQAYTALVLKFIIPALILVFPFAAGWANFVLDSIDGDIIIPGGLANEKYQIIDKIADFVTYFFILIWGWKSKIHKEIKFFFVLRAIGQILFFITKNELVLLFFPNFIEPLFLVYVTIALIKGKDKVHSIYVNHKVFIWICIFLYKMQDEVITHLVNVDRTELIKSLFSFIA